MINVLMEEIIGRIDELIKEKLSINEKLAVFGAGNLAEEFLIHSSISSCHAVFDNAPDRWCKRLCGLNVYSPDRLKEFIGRNDIVLIASNSDDEIASELTRRGFNNWISLPFLIRKIEIEKGIEKKHYRVCMIETTNVCNARCKFCINPKMKRKKIHMMNETFEKIIQRLKEGEIVPEVFRLHCSGEPLLDPELFYKIERLKEEFPQSEVGYTTNYSLGTRDNAERILKSGQDYITISLNAIDKKEYENIMGLNFDTTLNNIEHLIKEKRRIQSNLRITISAVDTGGSESSIKEFCKRWEQEGVQFRIMREGKWLSNSDSVIGDTESKAANQQNRRTKNIWLCPWLYQEICILSDGTYGLCCFDAEGIMGTQNVFNTSIEASFQFGLKKQLRTQVLEMGKRLSICQNCSFYSD